MTFTAPNTLHMRTASRIILDHAQGDTLLCNIRNGQRAQANDALELLLLGVRCGDPVSVINPKVSEDDYIHYFD